MKLNPCLAKPTLSALVVATLCLALSGSLLPLRAQSFKNDRERGRLMLASIKEDLKKYYYDPTFRGMNIDERFRKADEEIKQATDTGQIANSIAQVLLDLNDSHSFFLPPAVLTKVEYGWRMKAIGKNCYVTAIKPGSDAAAKGLKVGDRILSVNEFPVSRENLWKVLYYYNSISHYSGMRLMAQSADGQPRQIDIQAEVKKRPIVDVNYLRNDLEEEKLLHQDERTQRAIKMGDDLFIWKMSEFNLTKDGVDEMMNKARNTKALILDFRGNGGGAEETMLRLLGNLFDHDVKVGDINSRKESKPLVAKTRGGNQVYKGRVVVIIDSESASAAEIVARVVQLENRGTIIGDRSSGAVMRSRHYVHHVGADFVVFYGTSLTDSDVVMKDGKSLERIGVTPDVPFMRPDALTQRGDVILSRAASLVGVRITPEYAATLSPAKWEDK